MGESRWGDSVFRQQFPTLDSAPLIPAQTIMTLSVVLDTSLDTTMEAEIMNVAKVAFYQLCQVKQLTHFWSCSDLFIAVHETIISRFDYYHLLYAGLPLKPIWKLQLVQNALLWVLTGTPQTAHNLACAMSAALTSSGVLGQVQGFLYWF